MLKMKNAAISMAVVLALAACGGGGGDAVDPGTQPPPAGGDPNPNPNPNPPAEDAQFQGTMVLAASQVVENNRLLGYSAFTDTSDTGGIYGVTTGTNSPIRNFGIRAGQTGMQGQSNPVRIGIEIAGRETTELMQVLLTGVTLSVSETGEMTVAVPATARANAVVRNSAGQTTSAALTGLAADVVRLGEVTGDSTSHMLIVDLESLMGAVIAAAPEADRTALRAPVNFDGRYNMRMAISGVTLQNSGENITAGAPITVGDQPALSGGGVAGNIWINQRN